MQKLYPNIIDCIASSKKSLTHNQKDGDGGNSQIFFRSLKKIYSKFILVFCICLLPHLASATHIVGGALTYVYNGGNSYTVSLVLYRDCAGNAYPNTAVVNITQADGTAYTTLTLNPGTATSVPYTLDSCAQAPSPIPCVQKRTYTANINLPPTSGGYHLYYSLCCRNTTLSNTDVSAPQSNPGDGETFYAFIPGRTIWNEDFTLTNGDTLDTGSTAWTRTRTGNTVAVGRIQNNLFETAGGSTTTGAAVITWLSQSINISSTGGVNLSADLAKSGTLETGDSVKVYYRLDSGPFTLFTTNGQHDGNNGFPYTATTTTATGTTVQIMVRMVYNNTSPNSELLRLDNVLVYNAVSNNNPTYTQFPPLFLCAGKAFTFDHSATDTDGDSLYYSFYTPYTDITPTFPGNIATFTPIIWNSGYSASSPLNSGGPALTLNSSTGLLSGTPNTIGQFQVGIKTTEYRKGVKLSDMVRDFQFNIINCPAPAQAYISAYGTTNGTLSVCGGNSLTFPNNSDVAATNWTWNFGDLTTLLDVSTLQYPSYTYPGPGTYTARLIINAGTSCADTSTAVVTVTTPPASPTASGTTICEGTTATLTATAPGGTYAWYDASTGGNLLVTNASYTTPTLTVTTTYYVQTTVSGCTSTRKAVVVTVTPTPAAPTAAGTTICSGGTATLTATAPGGTYAWYTASTGGTLLVTNASYTTPTLTVTATYYVQTTVSGCTGPRTAVTVTVTPIPAAPTAAGTTICNGTTATLTATAPGGTYAWYTASTGGTLLVTNASYTTPTLTVTTTYYVQTTVSGCTGPRTAVTVTVTPTPAAPTAAAVTICTGTTATLTATAPGGTYEWFDAPIGGTLLVTNASYTTPVLTISTPYYVQTTVSGCTGPRTEVVVTVSPVPAAPTAPGTTICQGSTATLTATAPGGTYAWYDAATGGTLLITNASYTTPALSTNATYYVQTTVSGCTGPRTAVTVTVTPTPAAPTAAGTTICTGTTATLTATAPGGTYSWYDAATGGTLLITNASYTTPTLTVTTTYYVQTAVSGCPGPRTAVTVTVSPVPAAPTAAGTGICQGATATLTATAPGGVYQWYDAATAGTLLVTNASYTTPTLTVTTTYYVQTTVAGCAGPRTAVTVTVTPAPAAPTAAGTTICAGNTATLNATAPGGTYNWYDAATGGTLLATNASYTTPVLNTTTTYYVDATSSGCTGARTAVTVTVTPTPVAPTAAGTTICAGNTTTLTATAPGGTYKWYDAATGGTLLVTNASYTTPVLNTTTTYYVDATSSGCTGARTAVTVTVTPIPAAPTAPGATICAGNTTTLTATAPGGTYKWYDAATGGTLLATNASYTTPVLNTTTTYYVDATSSGCTGARTAVVVTVNPTPAIPTAANTTICAGNTATLTATAPGGTYNWYDAATGGTLLATNASYTTPVLNTTTTYYVDATSGAGCTGARKAVTVTVTPIPAAPTAAGTTICAGTTTTLNATAPGGTYKWYDAATGGTLLATNASYTTPVLNTTTTYYVDATSSGCTGARTAVTVTVTPIPAAPTASGATICSGNATTLTATAPGGTYNWYTAATGGTFLITGANYTTPVLATTTTYYVDASISGCTGARTAVVVTVNPTPAIPTAASTTICAGNTTTLNATAPGGTYNWYDAATGGTLLATNASYTTPVLNATTTYYVDATSGAGCTGARKAVTVTVNPIPAAPTASGTTICSGNTTTLTATAPGGTYNWYDAATGGTLLATNASYTTPVLNTTTTYYVDATSSGCTGARTPVTITVNPTPVAPTATGTTICVNTAATLTATAPGGVYQWYDAATGGTLQGTGANFTTPVLTTNTTYYVQSTINGCTGPRTTVVVTVSPVPATPTVSDTSICINTSANLFASAPGGTYQWYDAASGGTLLFTGASYTTPVLVSTTNYYVQTTVSGCAGSRKTVLVTVSPIPAAPTASNATICSGNTTTLTATAPGGTYQWYDAATGGTLLITNANYTTPVLNANTTYYVQTTIGGCPGPRSTISVTVNPTPVVPTAANATICSGNTTTLTATAPGGTYQWYNAASGGTLLATNASYTTPVLAVTTTYYVDATSAAGCTGTRKAVTVTVNPTPVAPTAPGKTICDGSTATLNATAPGGTYKWYDAATGGTLLFTGANYTTPALNVTTTYYVDATSAAGCTGTRTSVTVTVNPIPASPTASGATICSGNATTLTASAPGGTYTWYNATTGGTLLFTGVSYTSPVLATTTTYYVQTTVSGCVSTTRTPVTVTVNPTPAVPTAADITICQGKTGTVTATAPGGTYNWYDAATGGTLLSTGANYTTPVLTDTTVYYVDATSGAGCIGSRKTVTVNVIPIDKPFFNYASGTYCQSGTDPSPSLTGATGAFSASPSGLIFISTTTGQIDVSASTLGTYTVKFITNGTCVDSSMANITITTSPNASFSYTGGTFCEKQTNPFPNFIAGASAGIFSATPAGLTFVSNSTGEINLSTSSPGTYTITNNIAAAGGCAAASANATVTINPAATVNAGANQTVCAGTKVTMAGSIGGGAGSATWSGGAGSFSNASLLNALYTPDVTETTVKLYLTTNDPTGPCGTAIDSMIVTITPIPAAPTASGAVICQGTNTLLTATAPGGTYDWYDAATGGTLLTTGAVYTTPVLNSTTDYYLQTTVSACTSPRTMVTVTVNPTPATPTVSDATICSGNTTTLTPTAPGGTYDWYDAATGGALITSGASYTTPVLTTTTNYYVQSTIAGCAGPRKTVTVTVNPIPAAPTAFDATICDGSSTTLTATAPGGTYNWYDAATGGTLLATNANYTTPVLTTTTIYYVASTIAGCTGARTPVTVNVNSIPAAPTASDATICSGSTASLTATAPGGTYDWYDAATAGTLLVSNATYTTPVLSTTTIYYVQTTISGCSSPRTAVTVTVNPIPATPSANDATICAGTSTTLIASAPGGTYDWYDAATGGTFLTTGTNYTTPVLNTTTIYYVQSTIAGCTSTRKAVTVTVNPIPAAPSAANKTICAGSTATLTATAPGGTYDWYDASTGGTFLGTGSYTTPVLNNSATYYVQSTMAGCTGARKAVVVTVNPIPVAPTAPGTTICQGTSTTLTASAPVGTYQWYSAPSGGTLLSSAANYTTPVLNATTTYYVQAVSGGCNSTRTAVIVNITPTDNPGFTYSSSTYCITGSNPIPTITGITGTFSSSPAGLVFVSTTTGEINIGSSALNTYTVTYTTNGTCTASQTASVTITNSPDATFSYSSPYCSGSGNTSPTFIPGASAGIFSATPAGLVFVNTNTGIIDLNTSTAGTYTVTNTIAATGGCAAASASTTVTINPLASVNAGPDQTICANAIATLAGTMGGSTGSITWTGAGSFSDNTLLNSTYTPTAAEITAGTATLIINSDDPSGPCTAVADTMTLTIIIDDASFSYASGSYCLSGIDPTPVVTGLPGGTFSASPAGLVFISNSTGQIDLSATTLGTYVITYTTNGTCPNTATHAVSVTTTPPLASFTYATPFCVNASNPLPTFTGGATPGVFSAVPGGLVFVNINTGEIDLTASTAGTYTVTNYIAANGGCAAASATFNVTIDPKAIANAGPDQSVCSGSSVNLAGSIGGSAAGGTWTGGTGTFAPSNSALNASYTPAIGETLVTLILTTDDPSGPCNAVTDTMIITVNPIPAAPTAAGKTICTGTAATLTATAPGGAYDWYNAPSGGTFLITSANYTTPALTTPATYYVQTTILGCVSPRTSVAVTLVPAPTADAGIDVNVCSNNSNVLLNGIVNSAGGGKWTTTGDGTFVPADTTLNATYLPGTADSTSGTVILILTSTHNGTCTAAIDSTTVTIAPAPVVNAGPDQTICLSNPNTNLSGTIIGGAGTGSWTTLGSGTFSPVNTILNPTYIPSTTDTTNGTVTLVLTTTNNGGCNPVYDTLKINYSNVPSVNAGLDRTVCANNSLISLNGIVTAGGTTGIWSTSGNGTFTPSATALNATYTPSTSDTTAGSITLTLTSTSGCVVVTDNLIATITDAPIVSAGLDQSVCVNNLTVTLNGNVKGASTTGKWTTTGTGIFVPNDSTLNATYTMTTADTAAGNILMILTSSNIGNCSIVKDTMKVTYTPSPIAFAGNDAIICANNATPLNGTITGGSGTGIWTTTNGSGTFVPNNTTLNASYIAVNADTLVGTIKLILTSTGSGCVVSTDTVIITVNPGPIVNAGTDKTICANNSNVTLSGFIMHASGGKWTTSGSGTFAPTDSTLNATYIPSTADTTAGNVFLVLTSKGNGSCSAVIDSMHVIFSPKPTVNAGVDQTVCKSVLTTVLNGIVSGGATTGKWTTTGTGTFSPTDSTLNANYTPSTADTSAGTVKLILTSTHNGGCNVVTDTVTITYTNIPAINAGTDKTVCANNASVALNGSVSTGTGTWSTNGDGTFSPNATTLNATYTPGVNDTASGTIILTLTSSGGCSTASKSITITITPAPVVNAGTDQFICANNLTATLNGNVNGGSTTGKWTTTGTGIFVPNDSTLNATYTMTTADTTAGNILLILTSSNNGNCNIVKDTMKVTYTPSPIAFAGNDAIICANNATPLNGTITGGSGTGVWTTTNGSGTFVPNNTTLNASYIAVNADTLVGTIKLILTSTGSGCVVSTDTVIITVNPGPIVNAGTDKTICANNANVTLSGTVTHASGGKWTTSGSGTFAPNDSTLNATYIPSAADTTAGNVFLVLTSKGNGSCSAVIDSMHVIFSPKPTVNAGVDQIVCKSVLTTVLNGIVTGGATTGKWTTTGTGTFSPTDSTLNANYTPSTSDTSAGTVKLILTSTNNGGCNVVTDTVTISFTNVPAVMAGADTTVCSNITNVQLNGGIIGGAGTGKWTSTGTGIFVPNDSALNATYQPNAADLTSGSVKLILTSTRSCVIVTDTILLSFTPAPTVNANVDQTICAGNMVTLNGNVTIASGGQWTTTGTGTFNPNATTLNAIYTPSAADITAGSVKILLTSTGNGTCNAAADSMIITIQSKPVANFTNATPCLNAAVNFMDTSVGSITTWAWDFGNGTSTIQYPTNVFTSTGSKVITLIVSTSAGCADTVSKTISVNPLPVASFTFLTFCPDSAEFTDVSTMSPGTIVSWTWNFGDSTMSNFQNPKHTYSSAGTYVATLLVASDSGCVASATDSVKVILCDDKPVIVNKAVVPSAFTPNHDGHNDILFVKGGPFLTLSFRVFNEWGNEIFNSSSQSDGWDGTFSGKAQPAGTYVWTVTGTTVDHIEIKMVGGVTLIR